MTKHRFGISVAAPAALLFLCAVPGLALDQNGPTPLRQNPKAISRGSQPRADSIPADDFAGLNYTDEQRAQINKIHRATESRKEAIANDDKLNPDQKNAMLLGYTRMEYVSIFKVLSPEQRKQVRQRMQARKETDQSSQKRQSPTQ